MSFIGCVVVLALVQALGDAQLNARAAIAKAKLELESISAPRGTHDLRAPCVAAISPVAPVM